MEGQLTVLALTAASLGFFHTVLGPDHYIPFIAMSKARHWSLIKTFAITFACGVGHVLSSVILGFMGIALGVAVFRLEVLESARGEIAAWLLLIFGFTYGIWGLWQALRAKPHQHIHPHSDGVEHSHQHQHTEEHMHVHIHQHTANITPWVMFTIFVFGPCEPLIPLLMYPAAKGTLNQVVVVVALFSTITIATMLAIVGLFFFGLERLNFGKLERYSHAHAIAGFTIFLFAGAIKFLRL